MRSLNQTNFCESIDSKKVVSSDEQFRSVIFHFVMLCSVRCWSFFASVLFSLGLMTNPLLAEDSSEDLSQRFPNLHQLCKEFEQIVEINQTKLNVERLEREIRSKRKVYKRPSSPHDVNPLDRSRLSDEDLLNLPESVQHVFDASPGFREIEDPKGLEQSFCDFFHASGSQIVEADFKIEVNAWPQMIQFFQKFSEIYVIKRMTGKGDSDRLLIELQSFFDSLMEKKYPSQKPRQKNIAKYYEDLYQELSPRYRVFFDHGATYNLRHGWNFEDLVIHTNLEESNPSLFEALRDQLGEQTLNDLLKPSRRDSLFLNGHYALPPRRAQDTRRPDMQNRIEFYSQERYLRKLSQEFEHFERSVKGFLIASDQTGTYANAASGAFLSFWFGSDRGYQGKTAAEIDLESHWQKALKSFDHLNYIFGISDEQQEQLLRFLDLMKQREIENLKRAEKSLDRAFWAVLFSPAIAPLAIKSSGVSLFILGLGLGLSGYTAYEEASENMLQERQSFSRSYLNILSRDAPDILFEVGMWSGIAQAVRWTGLGISKAGHLKTGKFVGKYGEWPIVATLIAYETTGLWWPSSSNEDHANDDQTSTIPEGFIDGLLVLIPNPCDFNSFDEASDALFSQRLELCEEIEKKFPDGFESVFEQDAFSEIGLAIIALYAIENSPVKLPLTKIDLKRDLYRILSIYRAPSQTKGS